MLENPILTVAFVVAITAFFKKQFGLADKLALLAAFLTSVFVGFVPLLGTLLPAFAPWLESLTNVIVLFLSAAGSYDFIIAVRTTSKPPVQGL